MNSQMRCPHEVIITCDNAAENYSAAAWDANTGSQINTYKHASALGSHSLQLLRDSYVIGASATRPILYLWPLNSQMPVPDLKLSTPGRVTALACTPNGSFIAAAMSEKIYIWQTCNGSLLATFARHYQPITCLLFNKDGGHFASGGEDGLIFVWSLSQIVNHKEAKEVCSFSNHSLPVKDLYFGCQGVFTKLCSVSLDKSARIYDVFGNQLLLTLIFDVPLTTVAMDSLENNLYVGSSTGVIMRYNLRDPPRATEIHVSADKAEEGGVVDYKGHEGSITALQISIDGITLMSGSVDACVYLWDILSRQILLKIKHKAPIVTAFFATNYDNFKTSNFKTSMNVRPLAKTSDPGRWDTGIEVYKKNNDESWFLQFETKEENSNKSNGDTSKLSELLKEIKRLKKINSDLYEFSTNSIINSDVNKKTNNLSTL